MDCRFQARVCRIELGLERTPEIEVAFGSGAKSQQRGRGTGWEEEPACDLEPGEKQRKNEWDVKTASSGDAFEGDLAA